MLKVVVLKRFYVPILDTFQMQIEAKNRDYAPTKAVGQVIKQVSTILLVSTVVLLLKIFKKDLPIRSLCCIVSCGAIIKFQVLLNTLSCI